MELTTQHPQTENLNVDISGAGDVVYTGSPKVAQDITGSGTVRRGR